MKEYEKDRLAAADSEFSDYKKEIEATDNVILCVAKAERMVREIGRSLLCQPEKPDGDGRHQEECRILGGRNIREGTP